MYNKRGTVIFTTGNCIEDDSLRNGERWKLVSFELAAGERIIDIRSHDAGNGVALYFNF